MSTSAPVTLTMAAGRRRTCPFLLGQHGRDVALDVARSVPGGGRASHRYPQALPDEALDRVSEACSEVVVGVATTPLAMPEPVTVSWHGERVRRRGLVSVVLVWCLLGSACSASTPGSNASGSSAGRASALGPLRYPLTGSRAPSAAAVRRPTLAVKIDNVAGSWPQAGLNRADLVFDILVEGGLTRLMAVYQSQDAPLVGPVRSARPVDASLLRLLNGGYFAFSGASPGEMRPVRAHSHAILLYNDHDPAPFSRRSDYAEPHNLFSSTARLRTAFDKLTRARPTSPPVFTYSTLVPTGARTREVTVPYPAATAGWTWTGRDYIRNQDGRRDMVMDRSQVSATNVVIMSVKVVGTGIFEYSGVEDPLPVTTGSGRCWVLRNGIRIPGTWRRPSIKAPLQLIGKHSGTIPLQPGRTWVELMPGKGTPRFRR